MPNRPPKPDKPRRPLPASEPQPQHVAVGRIVAPWGVRGHIKVEPLTDFPQTRFARNAVLWLLGSPHAVEEMRWHGKHALLKLTGIDSREAAQELRDTLLEIPEEELHSLEGGQYYQFQIVGLEVYTMDGQHLGRVDEVLTLASNDVYVVHGPQGEILLPALDDVIIRVDLAQGRMEVDPPEGTLPAK